MKKTLIYLFFILVSNSIYGAVIQDKCSCYTLDNSHAYKIREQIIRYNRFPESKLFFIPSHGSDSKQKKEINRLDSISPPYNSLRYPDVYQNIIIFEQKLNLHYDFWHNYYYSNFMKDNGNPPFSKKELEEKIAERRAARFKDLQLCKQELNDCSSKILNEYLLLFEKCLKKHSCLITYHDYGLMAYLNNNFDKSYELLSKLITLAEEQGQLQDLESKVYHNLGSVCLEAMAYEKAIEYLTEAINRDPTNKAAYLDRAFSYFETGAFDLAIEDYLSSNIKENTNIIFNEPSKQFHEALLSGLKDGAIEGAVDFVPSLCNSAYGLGNALWITATQPIESTKSFISACNTMGEVIVDYCKALDRNKVNEYADQIVILYDRFDQLSESEKGQLIGYTIGKYGVDIFAGGIACKGIAAYQNLKNANRLCNLEAMVASQSNKEMVMSAALKHASEREAYLKKVKIHWDKQNKHIPNKHNYQQGKGTITLKENDLEMLVKEKAGKGQRVAGSFGEAGYNERVDFEIIIGEYALDIEGQPIKYIPTTKGIIKYAKDGSVHVVPSDPTALIKN